MAFKFSLEVQFSPSDPGAQDLIESALLDALETIRANGLELETPHELSVNDDNGMKEIVGTWGVDLA